MPLIPPFSVKTGYAQVTTSESTGSTSFTDLTTSGPAVTIIVGGSGIAMVHCGAVMWNGTTNNYVFMSVAVTGASTVTPGGDDWVATARSQGTTDEQMICRTHLFTGLTPGSNVFTCKYRVGGGTGNFQRRWLAVWSPD